MRDAFTYTSVQLIPMLFATLVGFVQICYVLVVRVFDGDMDPDMRIDMNVICNAYCVTYAIRNAMPRKYVSGS